MSYENTQIDTQVSRRVVDIDHMTFPIKQTEDGRFVWRSDYLDADGKRHQVRRVATTQAKALKDYSKFVEERDSGKLVTAAKGLLISELYDWWVGTVASSGAKNTTLAAHRYLGERYIKQAIGDVKASRFHEEHVRLVYQKLVNAGLSTSTIKDTRTRLNAMATRAVMERKIERNPVPNVRPPKGKPARPHIILTAEEIDKFLAAASADRLSALWALALNTGMRRGELCGLRWPQVDLEAGALLIDRQRTITMESEIVEDTPKSEAGIREIPLPPVVVAALREWKARQAQERLRFGYRWKGDDHVFTSSWGTTYHPQVLTKNLKAVARRAGIRELPLHHLRHTYATVALRAQTDVRLVAAILGHSNTNLTMNLYQHTDMAMKRAAMQKTAEEMYG